VNDATVTKLAGIADPAFLDKFGGIYATNNPDFIVQFTGAKNTGTGDGVAGDILDMQTSGGLVLQFDFARRFTPGDRLFLTDVDTRSQKVELAPAYHFLNTTIALKSSKEEMALPLKGKKRGSRAMIF
jgi:hypothetical protein